MYGPVSKDGPSMEFGEVGEEIKDEVRRRVVKEIVAKLKYKKICKENLSCA